MTIVIASGEASRCSNRPCGPEALGPDRAAAHPCHEADGRHGAHPATGEDRQVQSGEQDEDGDEPEVVAVEVLRLVDGPAVGPFRAATWRT